MALLLLSFVFMDFNVLISEYVLLLEAGLSRVCSVCTCSASCFVLD